MKTVAKSVLLGLLAVSFCLTTQADETNGLADVVAGDVHKVAEGFRFTEGPVWHRDGYLLFSDIPADIIYKWTGVDEFEIWREPSGKSNGLTFDRVGRFLACEHWNRRITRTEADGSITVIADSYDGKPLNSPNDLVVRSDGTIFFTDPPYGLEGREQEQPVNGVYRVKPGEEPVLLVGDFDRPNGIALSLDESLLYVADTSGGHTRVFDLDAEGNLSNDRIFGETPGADGMKLDLEGRVYITARDGVRVFSPDGDHLGTIVFPEGPANLAFGGEDFKTLFVTARTGLYAVELTTAGQPVWD